MKAKIGYKTRQWISFSAESDKPIRMEDAVTEQIKLGYLPQGYGFYAFESDVLTDGTFIANWKCSGSCE